jgi:3D-(3,5/4)-trihydroxycyclohexane-1,2-dione acylhydrolase (decyclizing)
VTARRLTTAQALIAFLAAQRVSRDGTQVPLLAGMFGIFGHGNVAGIGQAVQEHGGLRFIVPRNEQAMVHSAVAFARQRNRLQTFACTSSIGPGATNMVTGAALATINRLPVLLLPGDVFASRRINPALQQLELPGAPDVSVNDALRPVSRFFDRVNRPDQLPASLLEATRVLTDQAETGAVTIALPQDVQTEAFDFPDELFAERVWFIPRPAPDPEAMNRALELLRGAARPLIIAGGGVIYSEATEALRALCEQTGIPVAETQAGKGSLPYDHPSALGAIGATGTLAANELARDADLVLAVGTRLSDFTTASRTAFQDPELSLIGLNVAPFDAHKLGALALVGDARRGLEELAAGLASNRVDPAHVDRAAAANRAWDDEVARVVAADDGPLTQAAVLGIANREAQPTDVVVCAAGSMPGDLHKLWRVRDPKAYHVEYGYSCMGYELAGGLGVKLADPDREVLVLVGDGSWLMMPGEVATAVQEGVRLTVILIDNGGFASIGGLSRSLGSDGFGTAYPIRADLAANAASLGAIAVRAGSEAELVAALRGARSADRTTVIVVDCERVGASAAYGTWWDVPVAEVSQMPAVQQARAEYDRQRKRQRPLLGGGGG